jgi:hypothetical protein
MANLSHPELAEIRNEDLPEPTIASLQELRTKSCEATKGSFALQSQQKFLRRVLSPDSPARSALIVHGTGTGKTCTAIQVAEEYILRPEYQDKKVFVVASAAVQENFREQIFDMSRVNLTESGLLESNQCTGRRYLDMLLRLEKDPKNWADDRVREKLRRTASKIVDEFYEMEAYATFGNRINEKELENPRAFEDWIHKTFDHRLLIIDEAHAIRESSRGDMSAKAVSSGLEKIVKVADGLVLVLLTATPMYDSFSEILYYFNLFLWNDKKQAESESLTVSQFFDEEGNLITAEADFLFRELCQDYVSYVKGENPFTFPFRLPPPNPLDRKGVKKSFLGEKIKTPLQFLHSFITASPVTGIQKSVIQGTEHVDREEKHQILMQPTICVFPENKKFAEVFQEEEDQYKYRGEPFLTPEKLPEHSAKFASIIKSIETGEGVAMVYSNFVTSGVRVFAMALEEHGFAPASGKRLLANTSYQGKPKGSYILLTTKITETEIELIARAKSTKNVDGKSVRVIITSPITAEGVDFRYVRQIHLVDPWWNMSRIEQIIGRGLRTCSHTLLPFKKQNCTVYLHVVRTGDGNECYDEYTYRVHAEQKAIRIAKVRRILAESAMDCPIQVSLNTLPDEWRQLPVDQIRSEGLNPVTYRLGDMLAPSFDNSKEVSECDVVPPLSDEEHVRPLSTYLDVSDEILTRLSKLFVDKPIWDRADILVAMRPYTEEVIIFNLQHAIRTGFRFQDAFGRQSVLESKGDLYVVTPVDMGTGTLIDRIVRPVGRKAVDLVVEEKKEEDVPEVAVTILDERRASVKFTPDMLVRFEKPILDSYVFDHALTEAERRAFLRRNPAGTIFAKNLQFEGDTKYIVLDYNKFDPAEVPTGNDETAFREWKQSLLTKFIDRRNDIFVSVKNEEKLTARKPTISKLELIDGVPKRLIRASAKNYLPTTCGTGDHDKKVMVALSKYIDKNGVGVPDDTAVDKLCMYIDLLGREEHNCFWITPEELSVLYEDKELKDTFTKEFKKAKNE